MSRYMYFWLCMSMFICACERGAEREVEVPSTIQEIEEAGGSSFFIHSYYKADDVLFGSQHYVLGDTVLNGAEMFQMEKYNKVEAPVLFSQVDGTVLPKSGLRYPSAEANTEWARFYELVHLYGDTCSRCSLRREAVIDTLQSIEVVALTRYDELHPEDAVLNDVVRIGFRNCMRMLRERSCHPDTLDYMPLEEFNQNIPIPVGQIYAFFFEKLPEKAGKYDIKLVMNYRNGKRFEKEFRGLLFGDK